MFVIVIRIVLSRRDCLRVFIHPFPQRKKILITLVSSRFVFFYFLKQQMRREVRKPRLRSTETRKKRP